jgi:hypothetical protein
MLFTEKECRRFITLVSVSWIKDFFKLVSNKSMFFSDSISIVILIIVGNNNMILGSSNLVVSNAGNNVIS